MLSLHAAHAPRPAHQPPRIGLAIAGGGPVGAMYELGALRALDEACDGLDLTRLDSYVGVSSGAFFAAGLANGMDTATLCRIFITGDDPDVRFRPETFLRPALGEYLARAAALPRLTARLLRDAWSGRTDSRWSDLLTRAGSLVPTGLFDNDAVERFLREVFTRHGRSNDFRTLGRPLYVIGVDLDSGETVRFGAAGWDDVPISRAVQASAALPGLYPPVELRDRRGRVRHVVDGALRRTMHASMVLDRGIDLMLGINPLVPFNPATDAGAQAEAHRFSDRRIAQGGLPGVLSQTLRTMLQSRMQVGLARYPQQYPGIDQLVFEPNAGDRELFYTNIFSFSARRRISQLAYRNTLADLRRRRAQLEPLLARHGIRLREDVIADRPRSIVAHLPHARRATATTARLARTLDDLEHDLRRRMV
ncbi:patatin-like phospholipase family protein [Thermomonas haemolytica]|uniref:Putative acylesterase/phospholipase RssA n=1 Tax=Thermomonas haemolytica TaxID=141949 RepID=A0A4R3N291_9GAMM|nr:patatin-like phospholipase family protein [Thermomonas haemolytica]TCT23188.1 putative acylesterase/phospholipase RssA [Thermomonas haemolytica]TNY29550.1 lectin subunit beta [Thermomonas haemolytica]